MQLRLWLWLLHKDLSQTLQECPLLRAVLLGEGLNLHRVLLLLEDDGLRGRVSRLLQGVPLLVDRGGQLLITLGSSRDLLSALRLHELTEQNLVGFTVLALGVAWQHRADLH